MYICKIQSHYSLPTSSFFLSHPYQHLPTGPFARFITLELDLWPIKFNQGHLLDCTSPLNAGRVTSGYTAENKKPPHMYQEKMVTQWGIGIPEFLFHPCLLAVPSSCRLVQASTTAVCSGLKRLCLVQQMAFCGISSYLPVLRSFPLPLPRSLSLRECPISLVVNLTYMGRRNLTWKSAFFIMACIYVCGTFSWLLIDARGFVN